MAIHSPRNGLRRIRSLLSTHHTSTDPPDASISYNESTGLAWIILGASEHSAHGCEINSVVNDLLAPALLKANGITLLWHLHNTNPSSRSGTQDTHFKPLNGGCCALAVQIHDVTSDDAMAAFGTLPIQFEPPQDLAPPRRIEHRKGSIPAKQFGANLKGYSMVQSYSPPARKDLNRPSKGRCIVAVGIEPAEGDEETLDHWYRNEHLDLMAENSIFIRCTRYRLLGPKADGSVDDEAPSFLALHEYESHQALLDHAIEKGQLVPETPMSRKIFEGAKKVERAIWEVAEDFRGRRGSIVAVDE